MRTATPTRRAGGRVWSAWARFAIKGRLGATGKAACEIRQDFRRARNASCGKRAGGRRAAVRRHLLRARLTPMRNEPNADAMPVASPRRQVGHDTMAFTIGRRDHWIAAEAEVGVPRIAARPATGV